MYEAADCIDTASLSRRVPCADSSSAARYSMLATTPASRPNWCEPTSSRDGPGWSRDQALPLPVRQFPGLDVYLAPLHLRAIAISRPQPRGDVRFVVQSGYHHLVAEADPT